MSRDSGRLSVLHLSDVHAIAEGLLYDRVDGIARLAAVGDYVSQVGITPEVVIVTGDLIQRGSAEAYPRLGEALLRLEDTVRAPVLTVLGNHDDPAAARVLPGHERCHHRVEHIAGLRIVLLNSSSGSLGPAQLNWLREVVAQPHGAGTVVALHHPPLDSPLPALAKTGLADAPELLAAIRGTDVRAILAGHFHHPLTATLSGVCVSVGPSLAYHQVMNAGPHLVSGHDSAMLSLVHLMPAGTAVTNFSLHTPPPLFSTPVSTGSLTAPSSSSRPVTSSR